MSEVDLAEWNAASARLEQELEQEHEEMEEKYGWLHKYCNIQCDCGKEYGPLGDDIHYTSLAYIHCNALCPHNHFF